PAISPLSLHDALPICTLDEDPDVAAAAALLRPLLPSATSAAAADLDDAPAPPPEPDLPDGATHVDAEPLPDASEELVQARLEERSEEHTSELQSRENL